MQTLSQLAEALDNARLARGLSYKALAARCGLTPLAVRHALQGKTALRATNLMALADELGLELVLVPKTVAASLAGASDPASKNVVNDAPRPVFTTPLERLIGDMNARALAASHARGVAKK